MLVRQKIAVATLTPLALLLAGLTLVVVRHAGAYPAGVPRPVTTRADGPEATLWRLPAADGPIVVVMLFDGLAPSMLEDVATPTLDRLRREGGFTHHLVPAFPSVSALNGFTITTGCWPEHHGVVGNRFLDPERGFFNHDRDADWLTGCETIQVVAERQGVRTASLGWYGDYSTRHGWQVSLANSPLDPPYPRDVERAAEVVELLRRPRAVRPRLILTYLRGPDDETHAHGLDSDARRDAVGQVEAAVSSVVTAIEELGLRERATLIVTTDHGMRPAHRLVNLERILHRNGIAGTMLGSGSVGYVYLDDPGDMETAFEKLSVYDAFEVYRRDAQPSWSHVGTGPRIGDLIVSARPPYFIEDRSKWPRWARWLAVHGPELADASSRMRASHGYPPDDTEIHGLFYAWGAGVSPGVELSRMDAVDVHPTLARLLSIAPGRPLDGRAIDALVAP